MFDSAASSGKRQALIWCLSFWLAVRRCPHQPMRVLKWYRRRREHICILEVCLCAVENLEQLLGCHFGFIFKKKLKKVFLLAIHGCSGNAASCVCRRIFLKVCGTSVQLLFIHGVNPLKCVKILPTHYKNPATHGLGLWCHQSCFKGFFHCY